MLNVVPHHWARAPEAGLTSWRGPLDPDQDRGRVGTVVTSFLSWPVPPCRLSGETLRQGLSGIGHSSVPDGAAWAQQRGMVQRLSI